MLLTNRWRGYETGPEKPAYNGFRVAAAITFEDMTNGLPQTGP